MTRLVKNEFPATTKEQIDTGEAFHLWDHLTFRYDNIEQTEIWHSFANDGDFKHLLKGGLQMSLKKQATVLEKELDRFGIPLPKRPPKVFQEPSNTYLLEDDYMFRILSQGVIGAGILHALALKQCVTNDRIRGIFKNLLLDEIGILDQLIKFSKLKGWVNVVPRYSPLT